MSLDTEGAPLVFIKDQKYGLLDYNGKLLLAAKYDFISVPSLSHALYNEGDLTGVLDLKGNVLIPAKYETISEYRDNLALIFENLTYQLVDKSGKKIITYKSGVFIFCWREIIIGF
ncbi:WG repeat-containing protein [Sphingobacterium sp. E70]|uniref:WG repeat-containing protein n=1 Tax=Sphingobacterium sp. E70 TaxID=2853439 RepID=UPI00359C2FDF